MDCALKNSCQSTIFMMGMKSGFDVYLGPRGRFRWKVNQVT